MMEALTCLRCGERQWWCDKCMAMRCLGCRGNDCLGLVGVSSVFGGG